MHQVISPTGFTHTLPSNNLQQQQPPPAAASLEKLI
jgi:hypothetical protein